MIGRKHYHLDLSSSFIDNINRQAEQNNNEINVNKYENSNINPPFRYYNDDTNLNLNPKINITYKTKSIFGSEKPTQTEHDQIGINEPFLNNHFGYTNYGNFNVANQSLPEMNKHKTTPKNNLFDLL